MIKNITIISLIIFLSCSLYEDKEQPDIYFQINDFDILGLGRTISDMVMGPNNNFLYLCDYNNNSIIKISVQNDMKLVDELVLGSHPIAMDISPDNAHLAVAMEGESNVYIVSLDNFTANKVLSVSLMNMNDVVYANNNLLFLSSTTDPTVISYDINSAYEMSQSILNGELIINQEDSVAYVASSSSIKKYDISSGQAALAPYVADPFGFSAVINHFIISNDILYLCLSNKDDNNEVVSVYSYDSNTLTFTGKYQIGSPGLGIVVDKENEQVFISPKDADENGVFIIEFDALTKLEKNYYLAAGNLKEKCMVIDQTSSYIYILVNTPGDNDSFEPYNDFPFDLQRIEIYN